MAEQEKPTEAPLIGDFKGPQGNRPRAPKPPEDLQRNADEEQLESLEEQGIEETPPAKTYEEQLEAAGLTIEKARVIRDNVLFKHYHEETYLIANKLPVILRTRVYEDAQRAMQRLESEAPQYPISINDLIAHCNMAASLRQYGDRKFTMYTADDKATEEQKDEAFEERSRFLAALPTNALDALMQYAAEFDEMVAAVFAKGAPEDF